jgi:hypothetical protein
VAAALFASVSLPPPAAVRDALESRVAADASVRNANRGAGVLPFGNPSRLPPRRPGWRWFGAGGWLVAAASLLFAVGLWWHLRPNMLDPEKQRGALLAMRDRQGSDVIQIDWEPTADLAAKNASGDVVWSTSAQKGFVRFRGLAANAPGVYQYQLWLFDADRDKQYPVDGGVFDIPPTGGDVIVPITPKLWVGRPTMFAVTIEKPGGVVVSSRERVTLVAKVL